MVAVCLSLSLWSLGVATCLSLVSMVVGSLSGPMELLHYSHRLPWLLAVSYCLSGPMELLYVSHCLIWLLAVSNSLSSYWVAACLSMSLIVSGCLSLSHSVPWSFYMSPTIYHGCWLSLSDSAVSWSCYMSLTVTHGFLPSLTVTPSAMDNLHGSQSLPWFLAVSHCLSGPL